MLTKPTLRHLLALSLQTQYAKRGTSVADKQRRLWRECTLATSHAAEYRQLCDAFMEALVRRGAARH
jgi:hypothetical protein